MGNRNAPVSSIVPRVGKALGAALKPALRTIGFMLFLTVPLSVGVMLLEKSGLLARFSFFMAPLMGFLGLPGEAALVFLSSVFLNLYSAIAVIGTLRLSGRDLVILASLCLAAHNFFVESPVMKKSGSSLRRIVPLRLVGALALAWALNRVFPGPKTAVASPALPPTGLDFRELPPLLLPFLAGMGPLAFKLILIIFGVTFLRKLLDEFGLMKFLGRAAAPLTRLLGLSANTGYVWAAAFLFGVAHSSAVLLEEVRSGRLSGSEADLLNYHTAVSHSQLEDSLLFASLGVPFLWAALPRFLMAILVVYLERGRRVLFRRWFRVRIAN